MPEFDEETLESKKKEWKISKARERAGHHCISISSLLRQPGHVGLKLAEKGKQPIRVL